MRFLASALRHGMFALLLVCALTLPASAGEGQFGLFTNDRGTDCTLTVNSGATRTFYLLFEPQGGTRGGVIGFEFQIDASGASGYLMLSEQPNEMVMVLGRALSGGTNLAWATCHSGTVIPVMTIQVMNLGSGAADAPLVIREHSSPSNPNFPCPLANLCDKPAYTTVCVSGGVGFLNATSDVACGSGAKKSQWTGVKALYR